MTYEQCVRATFLDWESWLIALIALAMFLILRHFKRTVKAIGSGVVGVCLALSWAYLFYELNCVELIGL
ncbi:MAG: hypothetical protein AAF727_06300 [Pseudomonadota bacterium]